MSFRLPFGTGTDLSMALFRHGKGNRITNGLFLLALFLSLKPVETFRFSKPRSEVSCDKPVEGRSSFLWRISRKTVPGGKGNTGHPVDSYFFGTIHVPYSKVWEDVAPVAKSAFAEADQIFLELDLTNQRTIQALSKCQMLPEGRNLSSVLPGDLYKRLRRHLRYIESMIPIWMSSSQKGRDFYAGHLYEIMTSNWQNKRPVWVMLMLNSLTEADIKSRGAPVLDLYLAQEAARQQKHVGAVERVEEQCLPLNSMNLSQVIFALDQSLRQHELNRRGSLINSASSSTGHLIRHYRCGDLDSVIYGRDSSQISFPGLDSSEAQGRAIDEYFRTELLQKRNRRMAKRVVELLETYPKRKFFFAFGAGHFLGNHSVISYMEEMGYNVTHLPASYQIRRTAINARTKSPLRFQQRRPVFSGPEPVATQLALTAKSPFLSTSSRAETRPPKQDSSRNGNRKAQKQRVLSTTTVPSDRPTKFNDLWPMHKERNSKVKNRNQTMHAGVGNVIPSFTLPFVVFLLYFCSLLG